MCLFYSLTHFPNALHDFIMSGKKSTRSTMSAEFTIRKIKLGIMF
jgi:hypothetical protein